MKKSTKFAALFAAVALLVLGAAMTSFAYGWVQNEGVWKWQNKNGSYASNEWRHPAMTGSGSVTTKKWQQTNSSKKTTRFTM